MADLGSGAVLVIAHEVGRGKGSGIPVDRSYASIHTVIAGKLVRITVFPGEGEALEAVGRPDGSAA